MKQVPYFAFALLVAFSCGGSQSVGSESAGSEKSASAADDLDVPEPAPQAPATQPAATEEAPPLVTFKLKNSAQEDLVFSLDRGWQPVIFAFSGEPPNAMAIVMFAKFCTAACDAADENICPYCPQPERVKDIRAAEKRELVAPGASLEVPWDGQVHVYEKASGVQEGTPVTCECYKKAPVPPETYKVRACGLRITRSATASSTSPS